RPCADGGHGAWSAVQLHGLEVFRLQAGLKRRIIPKSSLRGAAGDAAIQAYARLALDCFAYARNDEFLLESEPTTGSRVSATASCVTQERPHGPRDAGMT